VLDHRRNISINNTSKRIQAGSKVSLEAGSGSSVESLVRALNSKEGIRFVYLTLAQSNDQRMDCIAPNLISYDPLQR